MRISLFTILGSIFILLKLAEVGVVATWSWLWVLSPFWLPLLLLISSFLVVSLLVFIGSFITSGFKK